MRIVLTGGGTGGHIIPIMSTIKYLLKNSGENIELLYIGTGNAVEQTILENHDIPFKNIQSGKWRRYASGKNISDVALKIPIGVIQSLWHLWKYMPDVVVSKGGYVAIPVILAAKALRIPIVIHESDLIPGVANTFSARFAKVIAVSFEETAAKFPPRKKQEIFITGNPIRDDILENNLERARNIFKIQDSDPVILVIGGSQGAKRLNKSVVEMLPKLTQEMHIIHLAGDLHYESVKKEVDLFGSGIRQDHYHLYDFLAEEMADAYTVANIVISRAGAGSLNEIVSRGLPSIIIPLEGSANDHQRANAYYYEQHGACVVIEEPNLTNNILKEQMRRILENPETYKKMSDAAFAMAKPEAAKNFAQVIVNTVIEQ